MRPPDRRSLPPAIFQSAIGLSITARCPIACAHCIVDAGRHRTEEMRPEMARTCLDSCVSTRRRRVRAVIVTGGEPFYSPALLQDVLEHASALGLVCVVVTNGFWATTQARAVATLERFPQIDALTISTDKYHRAFISLDKFRNAARAARLLRIPVNAAVCIDDDEERGELARELGDLVQIDRIRTVRTRAAGRAARVLAASPEGHAGAGGDPCGGADFPIVFPDGRVIACMGIVNGLPRPHPLLLGNVNETPLDALLEPADGNVFLQAMRALGPDAIVQALQGVNSAPPPALNGAHGACALCYAMASDPGVLDGVLGMLAMKGVRKQIADARLRHLGERWPRSAPGRTRRCPTRRVS